MDKFLLKICNNDTKRKWLRHYIIVFIVNLEQISFQQTGHGTYVAPSLNRVSIVESSCLLRNGFNLTLKSSSMFLPTLPSFGAASKTLYKKECSSLWTRCLAGSDYYQQNYVLTNVLQHYKCIHQCKSPNNYILPPFICGKLGTSEIDCGKKFSRSHVCLHSQEGNRLWGLMVLLFFIML